VSAFASLFLSPARSLLIAAAVFIPFEHFARLHPAQRTFRKGWGTDVLTGLMNGLLLYGVMIIVFAHVDAIAAISIPDLRAWMDTRSIWTQAVLAVVLGDLGVYGVHRLQHRVPWLWRFHAVHHSAEEMDWLVGFRFHAVDLLLIRVASLGPLVALHMTPAAIAIFIAISGWQGYLVHANVRVSYGPLQWLFVSPEFHHWHHSAERETHDTNYASIVACWDVVFGTMHRSRGGQPLRYGVDEPVPAGLARQFFHPFRKRADRLEEAQPFRAADCGPRQA
jgi:sterol desaturase/sphingolipid hydroxylase (fatty acid hydroxylase superfamily)